MTTYTDAASRRRAVDTLDRARDLVAQGWCQGTEARTPERSYRGASNDDLHQLANRDPEAQWCVMGAIRAMSVSKEDVYAAHAWFLEAVGLVEPALWNDVEGRTQAEVLEAFDRAIAMATHGEEVDR